MPLGLTAAASATEAAIHKKMFGPCNMTLIISNEEMRIWFISKSVSKTIKNEPKEQKGEFLGILFGTLGAILYGNLLTGKSTIRTGEGVIRAGQDF